MTDTTENRTHQFLWLDLETTGLDPREGKILEWAVVLAADDRDGDLEPVECFTDVVHLPRAVTLSLCDDYVRKMHTDNGLIDACDEGGTTLAEAEDFLCSLLADLGAKSAILAGSSVHFDLGWIRVHMPKLAKMLSHRVLDVSTLKIAERTYFEPSFCIEADRVPKHRALDDVLASLKAAQLWHAMHLDAAQKATAYDALCQEKTGT